MVTTLQVYIYGKVQGVCYRDFTRRKAEELDLVGWVKNCSDGSVESLISGNEEGVTKMVNWFHQGSPYSRVDRVVSRPASQEPDLRSFVITY